MRRRVMMGKEQYKLDEHTLLLLHFDRNIEDYSKYKRKSIRSQGILYTQGKFGTSLVIDSIADYILYDQSWFVKLFNSRVYTIDFWAKNFHNGPEEGNPYWAHYFGIDDASVRTFNGRCRWGYIFEYGSYNNLILYEPIYELRHNTNWNHFAVVSDGSNVSLFFNGVKKASSPIKYVSFCSADFSIGGRSFSGDTPNVAKSHIDEFRVSDIARWTSNFTPPTKPYV